MEKPDLTRIEILHQLLVAERNMTNIREIYGYEIYPMRPGEENWERICDFFGLSLETAKYIFDPERYRHSAFDDAQAVRNRLSEILQPRPNFDRLRQLYYLLATVKPEELDLDEWYCGTSACAVGHAALDFEFRKQGFFLTTSGYGFYPVYRGFESWDAICAFFGLTQDQALHLFTRERYDRKPTPEDVRRRIKEILDAS